MIPEQLQAAKGLSEEHQRMIALAGAGFHCSEILLFMGLEAQGKKNPDLIRAVSGLAGGIGFTGETCGALTGGACLLGLNVGRGSEEEQENSELNQMVGELVDWFGTEYGERYGGIRCSEITEDNPHNPPSRCPRIVAGVHAKVKSLLGEKGYKWKQGS